MAEGKPKPTNPMRDLLLIIGIFIVMFIMWVSNGGPERAKENPPSPVVGGTTQNKN